MPSYPWRRGYQRTVKLAWVSLNAMIGINLISALISAQVGELQLAAVGFLARENPQSASSVAQLVDAVQQNFGPLANCRPAWQRTSTSARKSVGISGGPTHLHAVAPDEIAGNRKRNRRWRGAEIARDFGEGRQIHVDGERTDRAYRAKDENDDKIASACARHAMVK
jgi:hypothetical protein